MSSHLVDPVSSVIQSPNILAMKPVSYQAVLKDLMNRILHNGFPSSRYEQDGMYANLYADNGLPNPPPIGFQNARKSLMSNLRVCFLLFSSSCYLVTRLLLLLSGVNPRSLVKARASALWFRALLNSASALLTVG